MMNNSKVDNTIRLAVASLRTPRALLQRIKNSYLQLPFLYSLIMTQERHRLILHGEIPRDFRYLISRMLEKSLWFWPRAIEAAHWATGRPGKRYTPENFLAIDRSAIILIDTIEKVVPDRTAEILDLGCNAGRHINALRDRGYTHLSGVDAMASAIDFMRQNFPLAYAAADVHHDLFQSFLIGRADRCFDALYTHGATIELVHPSFDIVGHMARVTKSTIVILIDEFNRSYHQRFWISDFARKDFHLAECLRPIPGNPGDVSLQSLFVFTRT